MARTPIPHAAYARESSADEDGNDTQDQLFSLPNGEPATFLLHEFENPDLTKRIIECGGRITDDDNNADVILTISREEYMSLKDKYAISPKTYVRLSGFVDRCIKARRFQLAPIVEKGVPGRKLMSRRTQFTEDDDEYLCQYLAEVLPDNQEGGRSGHFIYKDLIRRANDFGQYEWAHRHPEGGWRERYRKNRDRMDERVAQIVDENPPPPDGKGLYRYRRYGKIDEDDELNADNDDELDEEERRDSATDNEDSPVQTKRTDARRQEEEEEEEDGEGEGEGQAIVQQPEASSNLRSRDSRRQEEEESNEEQAGEQQPEAHRTRSATRRSQISLGDEPGRKRLRALAPRDKPVEEPVPGPPPINEGEIRKGKKKPSKARARRVVPQLSPRRTRARSRSLSVQPGSVPAALRTISSAKAKPTFATAAIAILNPVPESQVFDEFVTHSDDDDEGEMHEVEAKLQLAANSRGSPVGNYAHDDVDDDDDDDDDAEFQAQPIMLEALAPPVPAANLNRKGRRDRDQRSLTEEILFPSPNTRAYDEKKRLTEAAKAAPYVPPSGTRAASMIEKEQVRTPQFVTTRSKQKSRK